MSKHALVEQFPVSNPSKLKRRCRYQITPTLLASRAKCRAMRRRMQTNAIRSFIDFGGSSPASPSTKPDFTQGQKK
eukprot:4601541-Amphidinium_carterae.2